MFGPPGTAYIYRSYGVHWCLNFVCGDEGIGSAVLVRALEPVWGVAAMHKHRKTDDVRNLCSGPGKLCQALGITSDWNGRSLLRAPFVLQSSRQTVTLLQGPRIGITRAADYPWRFGFKGSKFLSRPFPA